MKENRKMEQRESRKCKMICEIGGRKEKEKE